MSDLDLLIIHPGSAHGIYGDLGDTLTAIEPPLWSRMIAGYVQDRGHSVNILDAEALGASPEKVAWFVETTKPRLICLAVYGHQPSGSSQQMDAAGKIALAIKNLGESPPIIMLGGHVSALPVQTIREESVDYVCVGEGPMTIADLLDGKQVDSVPGLGWRDAGNAVRLNKSAPLIENLGQLHGDVWELLPMSKYRAHNWQCFGDLSTRQPYASIYTSLGCPYKCSFCCINAPFESNRYRMRDPSDVVGELEFLWKTYKVKTIKIVDEMFVLNERHYSAICEQIIDSKVRGKLPADLNIWGYARVDSVRRHTLDMLRQAGFKWLALGIESGSKHVRDGAQKVFKNSDIKEVVRAIQFAGINVIGNYMFGLPDDDMTTMQATLDLAVDLNTEFANFYCTQAYPGSALYTEAVSKGWTLPTSWRGFSQHNDDCRPLDTQHISAREVLSFRDMAFQFYFTNPRYLGKIEHKFGHETLAHVKQMTTYKLKRKLLEAA